MHFIRVFKILSDLRWQEPCYPRRWGLVRILSTTNHVANLFVNDLFGDSSMAFSRHHHQSTETYIIPVVCIGKWELGLSGHGAECRLSYK